MAAYASLFGEIDDFDQYPIINCRLKDKIETNPKKIKENAAKLGYIMGDEEIKNIIGAEKAKFDYSSGVRGDGDCSIWSVLIGWSLFTNRPNLFIYPHLPEDVKRNPKTIDEVKKTLITLFNSYIEMIPEGQDEFKLGNDTVLKSILILVRDQLKQNINSRRTIDGDSHFALLAMLMGVNIKVRNTLSSPYQIMSYGNPSRGKIIRITTSGTHYDVHHNNKTANGILSGLSRKHWWKEQWKGSGHECEAVIQPDTAAGESKRNKSRQEYIESGKDKARKKQSELESKPELTKDLQSMVDSGAITKEEAILMMGKKKKTKAKKTKGTKVKKKTKAKKTKGKKKKKKTKAKKAKKGGTRRKRRKNAKKKSCRSLGSNMLCHRGSRKKLKKLKKLTKKLKLRLTRCSRRRMNKWK